MRCVSSLGSDDAVCDLRDEIKALTSATRENVDAHNQLTKQIDKLSSLTHESVDEQNQLAVRIDALADLTRESVDMQKQLTKKIDRLSALWKIPAAGSGQSSKPSPNSYPGGITVIHAPKSSSQRDRWSIWTLQQKTAGQYQWKSLKLPFFAVDPLSSKSVSDGSSIYKLPPALWYTDTKATKLYLAFKDQHWVFTKEDGWTQLSDTPLPLPGEYGAAAEPRKVHATYLSSRLDTSLLLIEPTHAFAWNALTDSWRRFVNGDELCRVVFEHPFKGNFYGRELLAGHYWSWSFSPSSEFLYLCQHDSVAAGVVDPYGKLVTKRLHTGKIFVSSTTGHETVVDFEQRYQTVSFPKQTFRLECLQLETRTKTKLTPVNLSSAYLCSTPVISNGNALVVTYCGSKLVLNELRGAAISSTVSICELEQGQSAIGLLVSFPNDKGPDTVLVFLKKFPAFGTNSIVGAFDQGWKYQHCQKDDAASLSTLDATSLSFPKGAAVNLANRIPVGDGERVVLVSGGTLENSECLVFEHSTLRWQLGPMIPKATRLQFSSPFDSARSTNPCILGASNAGSIVYNPALSDEAHSFHRTDLGGSITTLKESVQVIRKHARTMAPKSHIAFGKNLESLTKNSELRDFHWNMID